MEPGPWTFGWDQLFALLNLAVLAFATGYAMRTVGRIRKERHTTRQAEVAEDVLALIYESQRVFANIRNIVTVGDDHLKYYLARMSQHDHYFEQLVAIVPRCRAFLGKEMSDEIDHLLRLRNDISIDAWLIWGDGDQSHKDEYREARGSVFGGHSDDKIQHKLNRIESIAEERLLPIVRGEKKA